MRYKSRFFVGVIISFFVAVLNSFSLAAFYPLFEAIGRKEATFVIQFSAIERRLLSKALGKQPFFLLFPHKRYTIPPNPVKIDQELSQELLWWLDYAFYPGGLKSLERARLQGDIYYKLKLNAMGLTPNQVVWSACAVMLISYVLRLFLLLISVKLIAGSGYQAVHDLRSDLYSSMQKLPLSFFYKTRTGGLVSRLINDVEIVAAVISSNMRDSITNVFYIITCLFWLAYFNLELLVYLTIAVPLLLSPATLFTRKIRKSVKRSQELMAGLNAHLNESINGVKVIRAHSMEEYETARFQQVNDRLYWRSFKQVFYMKLSPYIVEFNSSLVALGIIMAGAIYLDPADFTGGRFIAFFVTLLFIIRPVIQLSGMYAKIQGAEAAGERIFGIIDHEPESKDPEQARAYKRMQTSIEFRNVSFTYPQTDKEVLHDINIQIKAGMTVALVGESGGGKSTLMDLLARFFDPDSGQILIDGHDIRDFKVADHRHRIGIVTQDIFLFYGSIYQNIAYGSEQYNRQVVEKAARLAHAHDFISEFYEGYNTLIGNRGMALSGGQRQRIAIARALLRDPEILILDEATSALDTESEQLVQRALNRLFKNRTTFIIAHRLSTIEQADIILVVSDGRIVDQGTHADLMQNEGLYARLQAISRSIEQVS
ncbi:MAG: ABC transporter ATP-binding protein [Leptospiraceae bacterium]|nr:ABC transporter ATP-binding protein [Leptospiraceae bacterium]